MTEMEPSHNGFVHEEDREGVHDDPASPYAQLEAPADIVSRLETPIILEAFETLHAAMHARFGSKPWKTLVEPAIPWAEDGFPIDEFQRSVMDFELDGSDGAGLAGCAVGGDTGAAGVL